MSTVLNENPWTQDPILLRLPWTPYRFNRPLRLAVQWSDGVVEPHPPVTRALREVSQACTKSGMDVIEWKNPDHVRGWDITSALYFPDGGEEVLNTLAASQEPILPLTEFIIHNQPNVWKRSSTELDQVSAREPRMSFKTDRVIVPSSYARSEMSIVACMLGTGLATVVRKDTRSM